LERVRDSEVFVPDPLTSDVGLFLIQKLENVCLLQLILCQKLFRLKLLLLQKRRREAVDGEPVNQHIFFLMFCFRENCVSLFSERMRNFERDLLVMFSSDLFCEETRAWLRMRGGNKEFVGGEE
jgi:hypothetical protein